LASVIAKRCRTAASTASLRWVVQVAVEDDVVRRDAVREAGLGVELHDFFGRIRRHRMLDIREGAAVAHQHRVLETWAAVAKELAGAVAQQSLLFAG
jgi:hypothetical protein